MKDLKLRFKLSLRLTAQHMKALDTKPKMQMVGEN